MIDSEHPQICANNGTQGTEKVQLFQMPGTNIFLLDTPGFDDQDRNDLKILKEIDGCLGDAFTSGWSTMGVLYLQPITESRQKHSMSRYLSLSESIIGFDNLHKCCLVTTKWSGVWQNTQQYLRHERELRTDERFWKPWLDAGARYARFEDSKESVYKIIQPLTQGTHFLPQIVSETHEKSVDLAETASCKLIIAELRQDCARLQQEIEQLRKSDAARSEKARRMARIWLAKYEDELRRVQRQLRTLESKRNDDSRAQRSKKDGSNMKRWIASAAGIIGTVGAIAVFGVATAVPTISCSAAWLFKVWN